LRVSGPGKAKFDGHFAPERQQGRHRNRATPLCIVHMFNHRTHHRGQINAMLTAAGSLAPVSDPVFMPTVR